jgi:hypothetical protein
MYAHTTAVIRISVGFLLIIALVCAAASMLEGATSYKSRPVQALGF